MHERADHRVIYPSCHKCPNGVCRSSRAIGQAVAAARPAPCAMPHCRRAHERAIAQ
jgi:hypothetical protein